MSECYYRPCRELDICNELIEKYWGTQQYEKCFEGHLALAEQGYPLAECQVGYFYYDGLGVEKDLEKAVWWTRRAADHGDRDGQCNLAWFYEDAIGVERDLEQAAFWYRKAALQDHDIAIDKCRELGISLDDKVVDKEAIRKELKCRIFPLNYLPSYKYTVICSNYKGKWILSKHKMRDTWETQGGHIEAGETPLEAARRELFEESGIRNADVYPVCDYWGFNPFRCSNGMVFLAVVHSIGELPESEMKEIGIFDELPENLTYPQTSPVLYREAEKLLESLHMDFSKITACGECCEGCRKKAEGICKGCIESDGHCEEWTQSGSCSIHRCTREHGVQFCGLCSEFPCKWLVEKVVWRANVVEELTELAERYRKIYG